MSVSQIEELVTAVSEIARNVVVHAGRGELLVELIEGPGRPALLVTARDQGPGIAHLEAAMQDGFTTGNGLGLGLPSARRLVDELEVASALGSGTTVTLKKWITEPER